MEVTIGNDGNGVGNVEDIAISGKLISLSQNMILNYTLSGLKIIFVMKCHQRVSGLS